ncbi:MAG: hypothetical protein AAB373_05375 [Patescibacteria group bacterium]
MSTTNGSAEVTYDEGGAWDIPEHKTEDREKAAESGVNDTHGKVDAIISEKEELPRAAYDKLLGELKGEFEEELRFEPVGSVQKLLDESYPLLTRFSTMVGGLEYLGRQHPAISFFSRAEVAREQDSSLLNRESMSKSQLIEGIKQLRPLIEAKAFAMQLLEHYLKRQYVHPLHKLHSKNNNGYPPAKRQVEDQLDMRLADWLKNLSQFKKSFDELHDRLKQLGY